MKTIAIIATLDTKGYEVKYLKERIEGKGIHTVVIDSGTRGKPVNIEPDIPREVVAEAAGYAYEEIEKLERGKAIEIMSEGIKRIIRRLYQENKIHGILGIGGADGAILAAAGMKSLPVGVPKLLITPIAQGKQHFEPFVGTKDVIIMHSVVDILGVNAITRRIFDNAVSAIVGMVSEFNVEEQYPENLIAATMYGNTTPAVMMAKKILEEKGYQVIAFHPNGTGGKAMEELIMNNVFRGVLDVTIHEIVDELFGGGHAAGPERLEAAGKKGIPQVVVPGCVDFIVHIGTYEYLPKKYKKRKIYYFNPTILLIRTTKEEMRITGRVIAEKLNKSTGPTACLIPLKGLSMYNFKGGPLYDEEADRELIRELERNLDPKRVKLIKVNAHINDPIFANKVAYTLLEMLEKSEHKKSEST